MENFDQPAIAFAIGITLAWLAGVRVYLTVFGIGIAGVMGWMTLPEHLQVVQSPWVLGISGVLALTEFGTDKIPGVDSVWDLISTLVRVPAGAFLGAMALPGDGGTTTMLGMALGGTVALGSHSLKSVTRALINASPEPVSNWTASVAEDGVVLAALWLLIAHPWWAVGLLGLATLMFIGVLVLLLRIFRRLRGGMRKGVQ